MYTNQATSVRDRLLEGAASCLREQGYATTTARDVAAASGCNLRSIGYHFGSTRELLLAAISLNFRRWLEPLIAAAADSGTEAPERIALGMARFQEALADNAPMLASWLEAIAIAQRDSELAETLARNQDEFRQALARTLREAGHDHCQERADALVTVCDGLAVRFLLHGEAPAVEAVGGAAAAALFDRQPGETGAASPTGD